ncbi:L-prolyl-[peptidyl carrier protein] synthetase [Lentzea atacamensis]|uniref:L-prolyl-[peptidyl carrier protein] synthetase n=1 Tax=Lentzea atacamensis TaxID=531938 RepID=A0A316HXD1_9PSEU|nr:AMP-binding protein [Lentzea atacamensis]PWK84630.1 L-prolyl-[peptidyl carrier protein] synthetase [Lentzea atacamensis]
MTALHRLVSEAARRTPQAPAVHDGTTTITYRELDDRAGHLAAGLREQGIGKGDRIVITADKSADTIALMQAALRVGAIYVPVAPANPAARVEKIIRSARPKLAITDSRTAPTAGSAPEIHEPEPDDPAYVLYTSGSTGEPKGVCVSHRNAEAFVSWAARETGLHRGDRLSNHAPFNFDLSVFDLYGAFHAGAAVDLVPSDVAYHPAELTDFLVTRGITVWYSVPSALLLMMRQGGLLHRDNALRVCVFAGEPFPSDQVLELRKAWPNTRLFNWYGPTETNVCTSYEVHDVDPSRPLPIGSPSCGNNVELDDGEIVVDGPTVMLGYWGGPPQQGPYRTGDLGRRTNGVLEYRGRRDAMVKVRGHRVELGEIETALAAHPDVGAVAVVVRGSGLEAKLHAVVVPRNDKRPGLVGLKRHCAERLPGYMIIDSLSVVAELPRTANGKADRTALSRGIQ